MVTPQALKLSASQEEHLYLARLAAMNTLFEAARLGVSTRDFGAQAQLVERSLNECLDKYGT